MLTRCGYIETECLTKVIVVKTARMEREERRHGAENRKGQRLRRKRGRGGQTE
jgi:hypothetical protein